MYGPSNPEDIVTDVMRHYNERARDAEYVALQGHEIRDLVPYMGHLANLKNMRHLNIASNELQRLPESMSSLVSLQTLNVGDNPIMNANSVVKGLFSLPNLKNLYITLPEEEEDELVAVLSQLETLNGVRLDEDPQKTKPATSPSEMLENVQQAPKIPRGYSSLAPGMDLSIKPWTTDDQQAVVKLQRMVSRVSQGATYPEEYQDFSKLVNRHLRARTMHETDTLRRSVHEFNAASLLVEYSFDEMVRVSGKFGPEVHQAMRELFKHHVQLVQRASHTMVALQEDRDRKIGALQEDLAKELLLRERTRVKSEAKFEANDYNDDDMAAANAKAMEEEEGRLADGSKVIPLNEMKAEIERIVKSKTVHDEANAKSGLPRETMEQHLYTYYYNVVRSDEEIRDRVTLFFRSIKRHARMDLTCEIFTLILKRELDEPYWEVHRSTSETLFDTIHAALTAEGPERGTTLDGMLTEKQVQRVVSIMQPGRSNDMILRYLSKALTRHEEDPRVLVIGYREFASIYLQVQLRQHREIIKPIIAAFTEVDEETTGVIDEASFHRALVAMFPTITSAKTTELVNAVDPHRNGVFLFSDVVRVVAPIFNARQMEIEQAKREQERQRLEEQRALHAAAEPQETADTRAATQPSDTASTLSRTGSQSNSLVGSSTGTGRPQPRRTSYTGGASLASSIGKGVSSNW